MEKDGPTQLIEQNTYSMKNVPLFKEVLKEICSNSTAHAIPNIARTDNPIVKIFWFILLLGGTGAGIYCNLIKPPLNLKIFYIF